MLHVALARTAWAVGGAMMRLIVVLHLFTIVGVKAVVVQQARAFASRV